jgi:uncharacterized protein (TIGR02246 family)
VKHLQRRLVLGVASAIVGGGAIVLAQSADARAAIDASNAKFSAAVAAGKAADIAALYAADAIALPPNSDVVRGQQAIQKYWQGTLDSGVKEIALTTTDLEVTGDMAVETGTATVKDAAGKVLDRGKYLVVWKQAGGQWKLYRDIWNSSVPMP